MSKKPVPSKKQCPSSTGARYGEYVRRQRTRMAEEVMLDTCPDCGATKRRHFACDACGKYRGRTVKAVRDKAAPAQEIEA